MKKIYILIIAVLMIAVLIWAFLLLIPVILNGIHKETSGKGTHTGYVTAIEENGLWFKTYSVYFKTDSQSSQEDRYCIIDKNLISILRESEMKKEKVTLKFNDYFIRGWNNCKIEDNGIIQGVINEASKD